MVLRNPHLCKLKNSYLFSQIETRRAHILKSLPGLEPISLGTGDTSEPLTPTIASAMEESIRQLATQEGYRGYGPDCGLPQLRRLIAERHYHHRVLPEEVVVSDGAGCDIARLQMLFGANVRLAVQDPSYPAYVDTGVIMGQTGPLIENSGQYEQIHYLSCRPENGFFPDLEAIGPVDIIAFCSPNNPTGVASTREQLQTLVDFAKRRRCIILYDAVYTPFIQSPDMPQTIYEIDGAREVAIECHSFSKSAGFTGVRLGWTVVPKELRWEGGAPLLNDWIRLSTTCFNGASLISQAGGIAALSPEGEKESRGLIAHYLENARLLRQFFETYGFEVYGGVDAPYLWVRFENRPSWDLFDEILEKARVVTVPGSGFGPSGENFVRFSAFGHRAKIEEAIRRLALWAESTHISSMW